MMKLEIIRHLDSLGRICIPKDFRKSMEITENTELLITVTDEGILLKKREDNLESSTYAVKACTSPSF